MPRLRVCINERNLTDRRYPRAGLLDLDITPATVWGTGGSGPPTRICRTAPNHQNPVGNVKTLPIVLVPWPAGLMPTQAKAAISLGMRQ